MFKIYIYIYHLASLKSYKIINKKQKKINQSKIIAQLKASNFYQKNVKYQQIGSLAMLFCKLNDKSDFLVSPPLNVNQADVD